MRWKSSRVLTLICHCDPVLDAGVGNLGAVATTVRRRVLNLIEITTSLDKLGISGYAPRNDSRQGLEFHNFLSIRDL